ncbi:E3 ubiquitin-protein ligase At1g63170 [Argentina anserina]|uniref:E3 ubiquitin-protein ligase At1g63170 n=1 Tax=Argentina anserina TaxID=57926 RepID=UPI0021763F49|nr:E3 ubiquitin-protein ligase At1g63170 [Potentilla anserina]XP_050384728.1 E3 ubiquitin-protein ligase At1g63170 [Potentilla anserina]
MDVPSPDPCSNSQSDQYPLLLEQMESPNSHMHVIDVARNDDTSSSSSNDDSLARMELPQHEDRLSRITHAPTYQAASSNRSTSRSSSFMRRSDVYSSHRRSPLNSGLWISVELLVTISQIIASIVVLSLSKNENPQAPLFAWIVGYASGCVATLPILYWRFRNRYGGAELESTQSHQISSERNAPEPLSFTAISITPASHEETNRTSESVVRDPQVAGPLSARLNGLVDHFKMALDCFFAVWFVVGNIWIFGGHSSPSDAPRLYRLCIVFLTFSCIGYAMPFILCATICCCLPCIISVLGFREGLSQTRGATAESISALPTYKFKLKRNEMNNDQEGNTSGEGLLAVGTEKERAISEEDAVCSICLANYSDNDDLRELTCLHVFHVECVDKWLKINASCPLCKSEVGESSGTTLDGDSSQQ